MIGSRRDRFGEPLDEDEVDDSDRHACDDGWLGEDEYGRPRACLICRPNLTRTTTAPTPRSGRHR